MVDQCGGERYFSNDRMASVALLVPSCDAYADLWTPLFINLERKWPDLGLERFLVTNTRSFSYPGVSVLKVGPDRSWSSNLILALERLPHEAVFLLIDDLFLRRRVDGGTVDKVMRRFITEGMNYLRFNPVPGPSGPTDQDGIGIVPPGDIYRSSTVLSLWRRRVLLDVLRDGESAWEFEVHGSARTDRHGSWFASSRTLLPYRNLVIKGRYDPVVFRALRAEGLPVGLERPCMSKLAYLGLLGGRARAAAFRILPRPWRRAIRSRFRAS